MPQVSVQIDGKTYRMACGEGEEKHLEALAERFDRTVQDLKGAFGAIGDQRLTVMAGITAIDRLGDAERRIGELEARLEALDRARGEATDKVDRTEGEIASRVEEAARRIERIATRLRAIAD